MLAIGSCFCDLRVRAATRLRRRRQELINGLIDADPAEIAELVDQARKDRDAQKAREIAGRSDDPIGTIRYEDGDCGHSRLWVRSYGWTWEVFYRETHGLWIEDHTIPWRTYPIVGTMPQPWIDEHVEYQRDHEADNGC